MAVAAVVLAAGQGTRYRDGGGIAPTKLVAELDGAPLVRWTVEAACRSSADPVIVVTGHARRAVESALVGLPLVLAHNDDYASGLASSLRRGISALPLQAAAALVLLGDMPLVSTPLIDRLLAGAASADGWDAVVPTTAGRRGNPVILARRLFTAVDLLDGDAGARHLLRQPGVAVREIPVEDEAAALDVDAPIDLERVRLKPDRP